METLGSWGSLGKKFITEIGSRIADATGEKRLTYFLFQAISMAAQRGNVASILGTYFAKQQKARRNLLPLDTSYCYFH